MSIRFAMQAIGVSNGPGGDDVVAQARVDALAKILGD
jgi:hypothetical protein